jgi:hypothetical protein
MTAVADRTGTTGSFNTVVNNGSSDVLFNSAANGCGIYAGTVLADTTHCADSSWHAIEGLYNNTSSQITVDGNNTSGTAGAGVSTAGFKLGNGVGGFLDGRFVEGGVINGDKSASFGALNSNIHAFWGF